MKQKNEKTKHTLTILSIITTYITISCSAFAAGVWVIKPHAESFVKKIHRQEEKCLSTKMDSLISINENHRKETRKDLNRVIYVLLRTVPKGEREAALTEYKEFYERKK